MIESSSPFSDNIFPVKRKNPPAHISLSVQVSHTLTSGNKLPLFLSGIIRGSIRMNELITAWLSGKRTTPQQTSAGLESEKGLHRTGGHYNPR
jgi:hypothetical protein